MTGSIGQPCAPPAPVHRFLLPAPGTGAADSGVGTGATAGCGGAPSPASRRAEAATEALAARIGVATAALGTRVVLDGPAELWARARLEGLPAAGRTSAGSATHLLACADGWLAISLARPSDVELLPAWLALAGAPADAAAPRAPTTADDLRAPVARCAGAALAGAAGIVGIPVGVLGEVAPDDDGVEVLDLGVAPADLLPPGRPLGRPLRVLDLSALWAGPLAAHVLGLAGAEVTKLESTTRPDASRAGSPRHHDHLNERKRSRTVDLSTADGRAELRTSIRASDLVVESSRPRALEQLGIIALDELGRDGGPSIWVSITAHGRRSPRVGFGDDAAVAGGLVDAIDGEPRFAGDALADPLAGLAAAAAALESLTAGRRSLIDVALAGVAAAAALPVDDRP